MLGLGRVATTKKRKVVGRECHEAHFLPYLEHWNSTTLVTKDGCMLKVIQLSGYAFETADDEDLSIQNSIRNQTLRSISSSSFGLYFHVIRRRKDAFSHGFASCKLSNTFADTVNTQWRAKHMTRQSFTNELYITVVRDGCKKSTEFFANLLKKFSKKATSETWKHDMRAIYEDLEEVTNRVVTSLRNYAPKELGIRKTPSGNFSEIMEFLLQIVNCGTSHNVAVHLGDVSRYLPMHRLYFGRKVVQVVGHEESKYAGLISLKEYGQTTSAGMLDAFLQLPYEFIITQSFKFTNRQAAITKMQIQQNRMI
ncbi:MAG: VirB4 family type IV secretion/conjugal transfer ATPase, partial [Anaplasma sp.]